MKLILCLLLLIPIASFSQVKEGFYSTVLKDSNNVPLKNSYARNLRTYTYAYINGSGFFELSARDGDTLIIFNNYNEVTRKIAIDKSMLYSMAKIYRQPVNSNVQPIISQDYAQLLATQSLKRNVQLGVDTSAFLQTVIYKEYISPYYPIKKITVTDGQLKVQSAYPTVLSFNGTYSTAFDVKKVNQLPALQSTYVQGRSLNGAPAWRGAETNEPFSYGPSIQSLAYDAPPYLYDTHGQLVPANALNGNKANVYNNSIFRTATSFKQAFDLRIGYRRIGIELLHFNVKLKQYDERTFIQYNNNKTTSFATSGGGVIKQKYFITASYDYDKDRFSNNNRNGFLNRVYQNALLTPISFENAQGTMIGTAQRRYSNIADNPLFLLQDNGNAYRKLNQRIGLVIDKRQGNFKASINQSYQHINEIGNEAYLPATTYFASGISTERASILANYTMQANAMYEYGKYNEIKKAFSINYILNDATNTITYSHGLSAYKFARLTHDVVLTAAANREFGNTTIGANLSNKLYASTTATNSDYFLPSAAAYVALFARHSINLKLTGSYSNFKSELPINQSFAQTSLLQYNTQDAFKYFPTTETSNFKGLQAINNTEFTGSVQLSYKSMLTLYADVFVKKRMNDIFPVYQNGNLQLANMANHQTKGYELKLDMQRVNYSRGKVGLANSISFYKYDTKVISVLPGYNNTPIAGFSNVYKVLQQGQQLGAIVGSAYLRDDKNNIIIGNDGYPLVSATPKIIGNPIPAFTLKMTHALDWKNFRFNIDWEWRKGGDVWNGTQAVLDYYGRSQTSADLRNTTGYIFSGVSQDGHGNTVPVNFYDATQPVENSRWARYGQSGVAEVYVQKGTNIRISTMAVSYNIPFKKYIQKMTIAAYAHNLLLWSAYKGGDPNQLLYDQSGNSGLDFFNLPSTKTFGGNISIQF